MIGAGQMIEHQRDEASLATSDARVLIVAPFGRDASVLRDALCGAQIRALSCRDLDELPALFREQVDVLVLTEEALAPTGTRALVAALAGQPLWSDLPIVLLAGSTSLIREQDHARTSAMCAVRAAGNVTILERPIRALTLVSTVQASLRARRRQYELRASIEREQAARSRAEGALRLKDEFLATVSHELRTPLGAILLWTRLLLTGDLSAEKTGRGLHAIERSAKAQSRLIEDLLDASRMIAGKLDLELQPVDLGVIAGAAVDVVRPGAQAKHITIETSLDPAVVVHGDPARMQQVLWNLLSNAVKFTPSGGRISVLITAADGSAVIEIRDTGRGVAPEFLPHMFERFRQAESSHERRHGGLGLGLAITRDLVALHGGTIRAGSDGEGLGTVFTIELPLAGQPRRTPESGDIDASARDEADSRRLEGLRVMLVEDDASTRDAMSFILEREGAVVTAVDSGDAALRILSTGHAATRPHVLLTDLGMPGMSGAELLERVRALDLERGAPILPAALITAFVRSSQAERAAADVGFVAQLTKPIQPDKLLGVVEALAQQSP